MNSQRLFKKFVHWLGKDRFEKFRKQLKADGVSLFESRHCVCKPLSKDIPLGYVKPDVWKKSDFCKKPLSWYWISPYADQYLVISDFSLDQYHIRPDIILKYSDFSPQKLPDISEKKKMKNRSLVLYGKTVDWSDIAAEDPAAFERWMVKLGIRGIDYEALFLNQCANHANFIDPVFYCLENDHIVPYSIGNTINVCSACLEFFNIIGGQFSRKLVVPCPGAVFYAGVPVNRYVEVITS